MRGSFFRILILIGVATGAALGSLSPNAVQAQDGRVPPSASEASLPSKDLPVDDGSAIDPLDPPASSQESSAPESPPPEKSSQSAIVKSASSEAMVSSRRSVAASKSSALVPPPAVSSALYKSSSIARPPVKSSVPAAVIVSSSSSQSSSQSSSVAPLPPEPPEDFAFWDRENFGYGVPVIDPTVIARPESFSTEAMGSNALLALLITLVIGFGGEVLRRLARSDARTLHRTLNRLPFQAILTILLIELYGWLVPIVSAQDFSGATAASLLRVPLFAFLLLVVMGVSNGLLNALTDSEGDSIKTRLSTVPGLASINAFLSRKEVSRALWFLLLLLVLYGIIGAYINPQFNLFPSENIGIILVAVITVTVTAYTPDVLRYIIARRWKCPAWFQGNITGLLVALLCVYVSRKFQLSPGYIYGLPVGLFLILREQGNHGLLEFLSLTWMLLIAVIIWLLLPMFSSYEALYDVGNLLFIILLEGVFFELLPLPSIAGGTIFQWRRLVWAAQFFIVVFLLFQTLFHPQGTIASLEQSPSATFTLLSVGCYAVGIVLLWGYVVWVRRKS